MEMLLSAGGRERDPGEFAALVVAAGLRMTRGVPTASVVSITAAVPEGA